FETPEEVRARVHMDERNIVAVAEQAHDLLRLARPHQAVIDEYAGQLFADRFVDQHRRDRAVDAAGEAADHLARPDLLANFGDLGIAEAGHRPVARAAAHMPDEIGEQLATVGGMHDLRVEHQAVALRFLVRGNRERCTLRGRDHLEAGRERLDPVTVAHPHLVALTDVPQAVEQGARRDDFDKGATELALVGSDHFTAELLVQGLLTIADGEQRQVAVEDNLWSAGAVRLDDGCWATGENNSLRTQAVKSLL